MSSFDFAFRDVVFICCQYGLGEDFVGDVWILWLGVCGQDGVYFCGKVGPVGFLIVGECFLVGVISVVCVGVYCYVDWEVI